MNKPNPYDRRKNKIDPKDYARLNSKWVEQQPNAAQRAAKASEARKAFWNSLHEFLRDRGGEITSVPYTSPVRLEFPLTQIGTALKLIELGYDLFDRGVESRTAYGFRARVYELKLPK
jgi:hypothetical protein